MSCTITFKNKPLLAELRSNVATNSLFIKAITTVWDTKDFTEDFKFWYQERYGNIPDYKVKTKKDKKNIVQGILEFTQYKHPDIHYSTNLIDKLNISNKFGYNSVADREFAKQIIGTWITDITNQIINNKYSTIDKFIAEYNKTHNINISKKQFLYNTVISKIKKELISRFVAQGMDEAKAKALVMSGDINAIEKQLHIKGIITQNQNLIALYSELLCNGNQLFDDVFVANRIANTSDNNTTDQDVLSENKELQEIEENEETNEDIADENNTDNVDTSITELNNKMGLYTNFMNHVKVDIQTYLKSLKKYTNDSTVDNLIEDKDNALGVASTMDLYKSSIVLYSKVDYTNKDTMIASIHKIADSIPGFKGFHKLANDMAADSDFANRIYYNFGKTIISKQEIVINDNGVTTKLSNKESNPKLSLYNEFINSLNIQSILLDNDYSDIIYNKVKAAIDDYASLYRDFAKYTNLSQEEQYKLQQALEDAFIKATGELISHMNRYYPLLNPTSVINYIKNAHNGNPVNNLNILATILKETINGAKKTKTNYTNLQTTIAKYRRLNVMIDMGEADGTKVNIDELRKQDYTDSYLKAIVTKLVNELETYSDIHIRLNNRNVNGKQSSAIINNSMLTNMLNTLKSKVALENYGKYKGRSRQYDYSNILIEHKDKQGNILNYGLFTQDPISLELTPTPYASTLLQISLLDGGSNSNTGQTSLYSKFSKTDYLLTAFHSFFNVDAQLSDNVNHEFDLANYLMRIPSDAPKNFFITAPKYDTKTLISEEVITDTDVNGNEISTTRRITDTKHPVYQQLVNIFMQELTEMAIATDKIFVTKDGAICLDEKGNPIFNEGYANDKTTLRRLYNNYHTAKGKLFNGSKLVGNVFKSNKFIITRELADGTIVSRNYGQEILDEVFGGATDILYGGDINHYIHTDKTEKGVSVYLTKEQQQVLKQKLIEFIYDYIDYAENQLKQYSELDEKILTKENIREFALNYYITYNSFDDIFEGNSKFYKNSQTFLKRAKEVQGSGIPYAITNYAEALDEPKHDIPSVLDKQTFTIKHEDGTTESLQMKQQNRFRGVTIKNTVKTGETIGIFKKDKNGDIVYKDGVPQMAKEGALTKQFIKSLITLGYSKKAATDKVYKMMVGYDSVTANDAQSYITFEEWVRRITARGQYNKYKTLIADILDETKPVRATTIAQFVQAQKNFYYDQHYNEELGVFVPRQIKNSEFVLIPRFIKGTQLEQVYELMKKHDIDQINTQETSKAGLNNVLTLFDDNGDLTTSNIADFEANVATASELYNYNYLYTQQDNPQHMNAQNKAGLQIMKKIIDNIDENSPLYPYKQAFIKTFIANIKSSYIKLLNELNIKVDSNGNVKLNKEGNIDSFAYDVIFDKLKDECARLGLDSNMLDFVTLMEEQPISGTPSTIMPTFMNNISTKLENISQSIFNAAITRQKLPGFHAAQISNIGWKARNKDNVQANKELRYHPDSKPYIEILLPKSNFSLSQQKKDGTYKTDEEYLAELQKEGLDQMIIYRMPTEGKQSMAVAKVVGFIDDAYGSTIIVPDDWVAQTGSDFDIDSVYAITYKSIGNTNKKIKYNAKIDAISNSTDARNNYILDNMIKILSSDNSMEENLSRSNFDEITKAKNQIMKDTVKILRDARTPYNIFDQVDYQEDAMSGYALKGISVMRDTFCSICNTVKPYIASQYVLNIVYHENDGYQHKSFNETFEQIKTHLSLDDTRYIVSHNTFGWTKNNRQVDDCFITVYTSQTTAQILDAIKEGNIPNVNIFTFPVFKCFSDVGSNYSTAISFIMQPAITEIIKHYNAGNSIYVSTTNNNAINSTIRDIASRLGVDIKHKDISDIIHEVSTSQELLTALNKLGLIKGDLKQLSPYDILVDSIIDSHILIDRINSANLFSEKNPQAELYKNAFDFLITLQYAQLNEFANGVNEFCRVTNPDKFGAKQSLFATQDTIRKAQQLAKTDEAKQCLYVVNKKGDSCNFIDSIYPQINYSDYINTPVEDSRYPSLNAFMKYATSISTKVNTNLFETQNKQFVELVYKLERAFTSGTISEKLYKQYQNYIIASLYNDCEFVANNITIIDGQLVVLDKSDKRKEFIRINGINANPNFDIIDEEGIVEEFTVNDINNPTQEEIEKFNTLSPAQKVAWVQQHFEDCGVFGFMNVSLYNMRNDMRCQTIMFNPDKIDIETIYYEFNAAFYNSNPLIALTAVDCIKYAFVVEGFNLTRRGITKMISNKPLLTTGFISQITSKVQNALIEADSNIQERFIRANYENILQIATKTIQRNAKKQYELRRYNKGIIILNTNDKSDMALGKKYNICYSNPITHKLNINKYIKFNNKGKITLYKIKQINGYIILHPLNKLNPNEHFDQSIYKSNQTYLDEAYYDNVIQQWFASQGTSINDIIAANSDMEVQYKPEVIKNKKPNKVSFNINDKNTKYQNGFEEVINKTKNFFDNQPLGTLYLRSAALANYIRNTGIDNGSVQTINGKQYLIQKVNFQQYNNTYLNKNQYHRTIIETNPQIKSIIEKAREGEYKVFDCFSIEPYHEIVTEPEPIDPNETLQSSITELGVSSMKTLYRERATNGDQHAAKILEFLNNKDISSRTASVEIHLDDIIPLTADYVTNKVNDILTNINAFVTDDDNNMMAISDPKVIDTIRNDKVARNKFLKTILDARALVKNYAIINELDINAEDESMRKSLTAIKQAINDLQNNTTILTAEQLFATNFLSKLSTNPLIQQDIISVLDGYYSASAFDAWINDLQETSNPLLQIVTKTVMADIRSQEMLATKHIKDFKKQLQELKDKAAAANVKIDWSHIIDDNGKFVQDYNQAFLDKVAELRQNLQSAKKEFGKGSIEYLKAKFEYDKFKLNYINQQIVDDYYQSKLELEQEMLTNFPTIYSKYQTLIAQRNDLYTHKINGILSAEYQKQVDDINKQIIELTQPYEYNPTLGEFTEKRSINDPDNTKTGNDKVITSIESAHALNTFIKKINGLKDIYFVRDTKKSFQKELEENLAIISNYEIGTPITELEKHEDYVKAKKWLDENTHMVPNPELMQQLNSAYRTLKQKTSDISTSSLLTTVAKNFNAYDEHGVINGMLFSDKAIENIKAEDDKKYHNVADNPYKDTSLISNAPKNSVIFVKEFYDKLKIKGVKNTEYIKLVHKINNILNKYYDGATGILHTNNISEEDLKALIPLYDALENTDKYKIKLNGKEVRTFIQKEVDFITNDVEFKAQQEFAKQKGTEYYELWQKLCERTSTETNIIVPNQRLFGYAVPKGYKPNGTGDNTMVDTKRTDAIRLIQSNTKTVPTKYYYQKFREMRAKSDDEFNTWYNNNHVYNPYTRLYQPISCWTTVELVPSSVSDKTTYVPAYNQQELRIRNGKDSNGKEDGTPDYTNHNYKANVSTAANYKKEGRVLKEEPLQFLVTDDTLKDYTDYSNTTVVANQYEQEIKQLFQQTLRQFTKTASGIRYLDEGYMASKSKSEEVNKRMLAKQAAKLLGWIDKKNNNNMWYNEVDYSEDVTPDMPMLALLTSKDSLKLEGQPPIRQENESEQEYQNRLIEYQEHKKEIQEHNAQIHKDLLSHDWEAIMEEFIQKACHFNAIQENKYMLFYAKQMLDRLDVYVKQNGINSLSKDYKKSNTEETVYLTKKDTRLQEQYATWLRRLIYDQWKEPNGNLTRGATILQSLASAKFMMLNITGGIANITVGESNILGEAFAKEYFGKKGWAKGSDIWREGVLSYLKDMYSDDASSLQSAIVKFMNVIDFDEINGVVTVPDAAEYIERVRNFMFSPQAMGEHFMQNGAMFSMMISNRLYVNPNKTKNGRLSYIFKSEADVIRDAQEKALQELLESDNNLKRLYDKFVKYSLNDANTTSNYAQFRQNLITNFAQYYLSQEQQQQLNTKTKEYKKQALEEFNDDTKHPTIYSQLKLGNDGKLDFVEGSIFEQIGDEAYQILGEFKGKVISVNKKIHGVYDKLGAAKIEQYWWGSLVMQYHKHLYPGIMKRYRRQGYYNEERGTIEKGIYVSIYDFLAMPFHKKKYADKLKADNNMTDEELLAVQSAQGLVQNCVEFVTSMKTNWNLLPEYERANIKRGLGDLLGVMSAVCMAIALRAIVDDDDNMIYNLFMYESDRLASESAMYTIPGLMSEGKKLWSSPVAIQNGLEDVITSAGLVSQWIIQGDDFNPYYTTGLYKGENKFEIMLKRQTPMYHSMYMLERLSNNNHYYKLGDNMLSIIPIKDIANWIRK